MNHISPGNNTRNMPHLDSPRVPAYGTVTKGASADPVPMATDQQSSAYIMKAIPRTGECIPAIGMGTWLTFDLAIGKPRNQLQRVMKVFHENGGRVIDTHPSGTAEVNVGACSELLGITPGLFIATKMGARRWREQNALRRTMERLWLDPIDLMQCRSGVNLKRATRILNEWKKDGKVRYVGVTLPDSAHFERITRLLERGLFDFIQLPYSPVTRLAEWRILRAALDMGTAVIANQPFEKGHLLELLKDRPLPDFAADIGCQSWSQFFLKWIIAHPAITCAIPATTNPEHQRDNMCALRGALPDQRMRDEMLHFLHTIPTFASPSRRRSLQR